MRFAYLKSESTGAAGALLVPANPVDTVALLKARTLLAFLADADLLVRVSKNGWTTYTRTPDSVPDSVDWGTDDYIANVPYLTHADIKHQPGIALVRNTFEASTLFQQVFLRSSLDWLHARPALYDELKHTFARS